MGYGRRYDETEDEFKKRLEERREARERRGKWLIRLLGSAIIIVLLAAMVFQSYSIVPAGYKGVLLSFERAERKVDEGINFIIPFMQRIQLIDISTRKVEDKQSAASSDLQECTTTIAVNYRLDPDYVVDVYTSLRLDWEERVIRPNIEESLKATMALFKAEELITKRPEAKTKFDIVLTERLAPFHIIVVSTMLTDFQFSKTFMDAIEAKVTAQQRALEAKNTLERVQYEQQQKVITAQAEAQRTIIDAEAYANATVTRAEADAEALSLRREQLNDMILYWLWLQEWDGKLPNVLVSDQKGVIPFIQIPTNSTSP